MGYIIAVQLKIKERLSNKASRVGHVAHMVRAFMSYSLIGFWGFEFQRSRLFSGRYFGRLRLRVKGSGGGGGLSEVL